MYHFGEPRYLEPLLAKGILSFGVAGSFKSPHLTAAQQDDEQRRKFELPHGTQAFFGSSPDKMMPIKNLIKSSMSLSVIVPYYLKSFTLQFDETHYTNFPGGACIHINDTATFVTRYEAALRAQRPRWLSKSAEVQYVDYKILTRQPGQLELMFLKRKEEYSAQGEYRFVLIPPQDAVNLQEREELVLGSLEDIATITYQQPTTKSA